MKLNGANMLTIILILNILNLGGLLTAGILYFNEKYTIVPIEEWNEIVKVYNEMITSQDEEVISPGGEGGFFREALEENFDDDENIDTEVIA